DRQQPQRCRVAETAPARHRLSARVPRRMLTRVPQRKPVILAAGLVAVALLRPLPGASAQQPAAPSAPAVSPALPPVFTVVVDPGHGGDDHGAVGSTGAEEKTLVLAVAQRLQSLAASHGGLHVRLTREDDRNLSLDQRATAANVGAGGLFISLHANFSP